MCKISEKLCIELWKHLLYLFLVNCNHNRNSHLSVITLRKNKFSTNAFSKHAIEHVTAISNKCASKLITNFWFYNLFFIMVFHFLTAFKKGFTRLMVQYINGLLIIFFLEFFNAIWSIAFFFCWTVKVGEIFLIHQRNIWDISDSDRHLIAF